MAAPAPTTVDEYIASAPEDRRPGLIALREAVLAAAPDAIEVIAYRMPALRSHGGQFLVSFDAYKNHYSLFPASEAVVEELGDALTPHLAGKGTIQFRADEPIPSALVTWIVQIRFAENAAAAKGG